MNPIILQLILQGAQNASRDLARVGQSGASMGDGVGRGANNARNSLRSLSSGLRSLSGQLSGSLAPVAGQLNAIAARADAAATRIRVARSSAVARLGGAENVQRIEATGGQLVGAGAVGVGAGMGMGALLFKNAQDAGQIETVRMGFETMLGTRAKADKMLADVVEFDAKSPFDFEGSAKGTQRLLAMGFAAEEVMPMMYGLGDAVGAAGGGSEAFKGAIMAMGQMKAKGKLSMEEINQLAERGIPALDILTEKLNWTKKQKADFMQGTLSVDSDTGLNALREGFKDRFSGGMEKQAATLPGQLATLQGALFQLSAALGQHLLPPIKMVIAGLTMLSNFFTALPAPIQAVVAYGAGILAFLLVFGGGLLMIGGFAAMNIVNLMTLAGTLGITSFSVAGLSGALFGTLIPALIGALGPLALVAIAIGGLILAVKGFEDASTKSAGAMREQYGALGDFWVRAGDALSAIMNHPFWSFVGRVLDPLNLTGIRDDNIQAGEKADREFYNQQVERRKQGKKSDVREGETFEAWQKRMGRGRESEDEQNETAAQYRERTAKDAQKKSATPTSPTPAPPVSSIPSAPSPLGMPGFDPSLAAQGPLPHPGAGMGTFAGMPNTQIEELEDQIARSKKNYDPNSLQEQMRRARRAEKHQNEAEREERKRENEEKRVQKARERDEKRAQKAQEKALRTNIRNAEKAEKLERQQTLALALAPLEDILASKNATKADKEAAREEMRRLRRDDKFTSLGLSGDQVGASTMPPRSGVSFLEMLLGGASLSSLGKNATGSASQKSDSLGAASSMNASLVSQQPVGGGRVRVVFEGILNTDGGFGAAVEGLLG